MTDLESLFDLVATKLAVPRAEPADSFVLHAPLELLARRRLLGWIAEADRADAEKHLAHHVEAIGAGWDAFSGPAPVGEWTAVPGGDPDGGASGVVGSLAPAIAARTSAAGHAPIFLASLEAEGHDAARWLPMLGPLVRELDRHPDWVLTWFEQQPPDGGGDPAQLARALAGPPSVGRGESRSIHPTMLRIDRGIDGAEPIAREILGPVLPALDDAALGDEALADDRFVAWRTVLLRTAAASMLLDTPDAAPYGWTHCLTMPLAVLQLADRIGRRRALAVAATHVLGFRCGLAEATVGPGDFAGWVRPVAEDRFAGEAAALALTATRRHDAHLVKYSLAVLEAARLDPAAARLYLEAGRALVAWWDERGETSLDT